MSNRTREKDLRDENPSLYAVSPAVSSMSRSYAYVHPSQLVEPHEAKTPLTNLNTAGEAGIVNEEPLHGEPSSFTSRQSHPRENRIVAGQESQGINQDSHATSSESANGLDPTTSPITTYHGRGTTKPGIDPKAHTIIYTGETAPEKLPHEKLYKDPIQVTEKEEKQALDPLSRVNLGISYVIGWDIKVVEIGAVKGKSLRLLKNYREIVKKEVSQLE